MLSSRSLQAFLVLAICLVRAAEGKTWALLVAGSNGYGNYRHQADACHAYHILRNHGIPQENIVTMMYDDIANNEENPFKGNIINQPNGPNVYPGVLIDYTKKEVTPEVFLAVLSGNKKKVKELIGEEGRVIESTSEDHVFVNFVDHGAPGLLAFPEKVLHARQLEKTLKKMYTKKQYNKMVLYIEACESGSMFYKLLPKDINIYAATAANRSQSSYACYFDKKRQTYLGDTFSVNWMQDSDKENLGKETLQQQYAIVRKETNESQVMEFGDLSIMSMVVAEFQGDQASSVIVPTPAQHPSEDSVPAPEVPMKILEFKHAAAKTHQARRRAAQAIHHLQQHQSAVDSLFKSAVSWIGRSNQEGLGQGGAGVVHFQAEAYTYLTQQRQEISQWACYEDAVETLIANCPRLRLQQDHYALQRLFVLVNLCEAGHAPTHVRSALAMAARDHPDLCATV